MPPKQRELTRNQVSSRLAYNASTPAFLQRMQAQVSRQTGRRYGNDDDEDDDEDAPQVEFESLDADRPAIPVRPRSPKPPRGRRRDEGDDEKEEDEEDEPEDERPQVVVLTEGKHLSEAQVENEKRKAQGLPPLPIDPPDSSSQDTSHMTDSQPQKERKQPSATMAFSSSSRKDAATNEKRSAAKRRAANIGDGDDDDAPAKKKVKAKAKKPEKKLLSFGDEG